MAQSPQTRRRKSAKARRRKQNLMVGLIAALMVMVIGVGVFLWIYSRDDGLIFNNVYAMDVNLSGMTQEQAESAVEKRIAQLYNQNLVIKLQDRELVLTPEQTGVSVDAGAVARAAFDYGREGNMFQRAKARSAADLTTYTIDLREYISYNKSYIEQAVEALGQEIYTPLTQPSVSVEGEQPDLSLYVMPDYVPETENDQLIVVDPEQQELVEGGLKLKVNMGVAGRELDTQALLERVFKAYEEADFSEISTTYTVTQPNTLNADEIYAQYCVDAVDAALNTEDYTVSQESIGYGFLKEELQAALELTEEGGDVTLDFWLKVPQKTKAAIEAELFKDILVELSTKHTNNANRTTNLRLAAAEIDGYILKPGETFSFNDIVGKRTAEKGYKEATVYSGMSSVEEVGGGICQVASTLYYAALLADYEIVERTAHKFRVDYVPMGCDATIYWGSLDFKFKNNTDYPVKININVSGGKVNLVFTGTETKDYYIKMEWDEKERTDWEVVEVLLTDKNKEKYKDYKVGDTLVSPYTGYEGNTYKCKYDKETNKRISRELEAYSFYTKRDKQILVDKLSTDKTPEPTTKPTDPPAPTDPPETTDPPAPTEPEPTEDPGGGE